MYDKRPARLRRWSFALGASLVAMAAAAPASAECAPDPTTANGITNCNETDDDGLTVNTSNTQVVVASDAIVRPGSAVAAINVTSTYDSITVNGLVDGMGKPGIAVTAGPPVSVPCDPYAGASVGFCTPGSTMPSYPSVSATINVAAGGTVIGTQALLISRDPSNTNGYEAVSLTNAGTMTGTGGPAIIANTGTTGSLIVGNLAGGWIGGMSGTIGSVANAGTIDGGANAAIATTVSGAFISNTGRIVSNGPAATISGTDALFITNAAGATLGGSTIAISAGGALTLTNDGTINGSVVSTAGAGQSSLIDTRNGVINGNLTLGAGDDTVRALFDMASGTTSSVTGTIDGGAGTDTLAIGVAGDATLGGVTLPTNFELLGLDLSNNATVTLAPGFTSDAGIALSGYGSLINKANLVTGGPAVKATATGWPLSFTNAGSITATLSSGQTAVDTPTDVINSGTITANGGAGVRAGSALTNSGVITATGTAVNIVYGTLANSGTIQSLAGTGVTISSPASYTISTNDGTISGPVAVALDSGTLVNNGTISGGITGVDLGYSATLVNAVGGTVTGGTDGVHNAGLNVGVVNAGTINGNVTLARTTGYDSSNDIFVDAGGTVNGMILLGGGDDQLVVDLAGTAGRPLAGATSGVDPGAGYDTLRFRVNADASTTLALQNGFEGYAYELDNNAALALNVASPLTATVGLTGNGTVTLNGTLSTSDRTLIDATIRTADQLTVGTAGPAQALSIVNDGTLTLTTTQPYGYTTLYAINAGTADVTNNGAITVDSAPGSYFPGIAIFNGDTVTNAGTITLTAGGTAIANAQHVVNSGTILGNAGTSATGVSFFTSLDNSGTIRVDGNAVQVGYGGSSILNSGVIQSRTAAAVTLGSNSSLVNAAGGTITGVTAVDITGGGTVINRGTIIGDVASYPYSYGRSVYVADGGTLAGNVTFGAAGDLFIETGAGNGVSGTIDGGDGRDVFGHVVSTSANIALDDPHVVKFEDALILANAGGIATLTAAAPLAGSLHVGGDGAVINTAVIAGGVTTDIPSFAGSALPNSPASIAAFENRGTIEGGVSGSVASFANSGQVDDSVMLFGGGALSLTNSGTIAAATDSSDVLPALLLDSHGAGGASATVANSGTIGAVQRNGIGMYAGNFALTLDNSGVINGGTVNAEGTLEGAAILANVGLANTIRNSGTLAGAVVLGDGDDRLENSGTITGPVLLGGGNDVFVQHAGSTLGGTIDGGEGSDVYLFDSAGSGSLAADRISGFEQLASQGSGKFTLTDGAFAFDRVTVASNFTIAANASLATPMLSFGAAGGNLTIAGGFAGSVTGGAGVDSIDISGGSVDAPVAFTAISDVDALRMSAGLATITGSARLGAISLSGGRLIGLAGSTIAAPTITVGSGAIFGSAGTVNGNIVVNGTLSPGASPGTMTVNGNVTLASSSVSLFEITPTVSDKLLINGSLSIAQGATLQLAGTPTVKPGQTLDLISATGGITGSFTNILRSESLFGVVIQEGTSISLLGEFRNDPALAPQVQRSIAYVNGLLMGGQASSGLLAGASLLATTPRASSETAFAQLTPEAYASAGQITVERGLALADAGRGDDFAAHRESAGAFTFASALASTSTLDGSAEGAARTRVNSYGFLGGIGWGSSNGSIGGFVGYLDSHQTLGSLGARTDADGVIIGIHGRWNSGNLGLKATIAYDGSNAKTRRALPGGSAVGDYDLHGWTADARIDYAMRVGSNWVVLPSLGATAIRVSRDGVVETGGSAFALDVSRRRDDALFLDGTVTFRGGMRDGATIRPYLSVGVRYQADGRTPYALAALDGGGYGLLAAGAPHTPALATGALGSDFVLSKRLVLFGGVSGAIGNADRRASARAGLRLAF